MMQTIPGPDGLPRCFWCSQTPDFFPYHDTEWGFPVKDDRRLFEKLCLEGFQAGLSWRTILAKRENFRHAFLNFDFNELSEFTEKDILRLMDNPGIVRHRGKIEAVINNAACARKLINEYGSLAAYFWAHEPEAVPVSANPVSTSTESVKVSKDLKKRGWKFVGPTTVYSFMQAMGLVNDHAEQCVTREAVTKARERFKRPVAHSK